MLIGNGLTALFVGDLNEYSKGLTRLKTLRDLAVNVWSFSHTPPGNLATGSNTPSIASRLARKAGHQIDTQGVNEWLLERMETGNPDFVWIEKGNMIRPATLERLRARRKNTIIVSYSDDDMCNPTNATRAYRSCVPLYDLIFTTKTFNANPDELPALGARRVVVVHKAYDPAQHFPIEISEAERLAFGADVGFIGSYEEDRARQMVHLARTGVGVRVWGNGWENFQSDEPSLVVERRPLVNTPDDLLYTKGIAAMRINLAFLRKANRDLHTDRSIEIPACGGFMLAEYSTEHARMFTEGYEAEFFRKPEELVDKVIYYLRYKKERAEIAAAGRNRCLNDGYSQRDKVSFMLEQIISERGRQESESPSIEFSQDMVPDF